jgi:RimJ/RimL family protein N-acetyltransferase
VGVSARGPATAPLVTARLRLETLRVDDAGAMVAVLADPELYRFTGGEPPPLAALRRRYEAQVAGRSPDGREAWHNWIVRLADDGASIGFVQATVVDDDDGAGACADVAWLIGVPWQGLGYAAEAAGALVAWLLARGVTPVTAHVHPDHAASARVAERAGLSATTQIEDGERVWRRG